MLNSCLELERHLFDDVFRAFSKEFVHPVQVCAFCVHVFVLFLVSAMHVLYYRTCP